MSTCMPRDGKNSSQRPSTSMAQKPRERSPALNTPIPVSSLAKISAAVGAPAADHGHVVQFYKDDGFLLDTLMQSVAPALESGAAVVIVATKLHRDGLRRRLKQRAAD